MNLARAIGENFTHFTQSPKSMRLSEAQVAVCNRKEKARLLSQAKMMGEV